MTFINIGFSNLVAAERIIAVASPDSAPMKRLVQEAREESRVIDCTSGKKTKSVIVTDSGHVVLSALTPESVSERMGDNTDNAGNKPAQEEI